MQAQLFMQGVGHARSTAYSGLWRIMATAVILEIPILTLLYSLPVLRAAMQRPHYAVAVAAHPG